jgi:hypothetical protein
LRYLNPYLETFLTHLAVQEQVAASTQNQALSAILFLDREVLKQDLGISIDAVRAKHSRYVPHKDVQTTMIYTHVLNRGGRGVKSPLD